MRDQLMVRMRLSRSADDVMALEQGRHDNKATSRAHLLFLLLLLLHFWVLPL